MVGDARVCENDSVAVWVLADHVPPLREADGVDVIDKEGVIWPVHDCVGVAVIVRPMLAESVPVTDALVIEAEMLALAGDRLVEVLNVTDDGVLDGDRTMEPVVVPDRVPLDDVVGNGVGVEDGDGGLLVSEPDSDRKRLWLPVEELVMLRKADDVSEQVHEEMVLLRVGVAETEALQLMEPD